MKTRVYRKCPFCSQEEFFVEKYGRNLYLLSCASPDTSAGYWVELNKRGRFSRVSVKEPQKRQESIKNKSEFDKLQIPFWKLMGQKPKARDIVYEKYLKSRGMTYGDAVIERSLNGEYTSAYEQFNKAR